MEKIRSMFQEDYSVNLVEDRLKGIRLEARMPI